MVSQSGLAEGLGYWTDYQEEWEIDTQGDTPAGLLDRLLREMFNTPIPLAPISDREFIDRWRQARSSPADTPKTIAELLQHPDTAAWREATERRARAALICALMVETEQDVHERLLKLIDVLKEVLDYTTLRADSLANSFATRFEQIQQVATITGVSEGMLAEVTAATTVNGTTLLPASLVRRHLQYLFVPREA